MCAWRKKGALCAAIGLVAAVATAVPARAEDPQPAASSAQAAPFRAKLVSNVARARKAATAFASVAKQPPPKNLAPADRKLYEEQSRWLAEAAARFTAVRTQMDAVLAKGQKAPATEIAQMSMQLLQLEDAVVAESRRFDKLSAQARARHEAPLKAMRDEK
jgi:hypothetical protein